MKQLGVMALVGAALAGCHSVAADPPGSVTVALKIGGQNGIDFESGRLLTVAFGKCGNVAASDSLDVSIDNNLNFEACPGPLVDVGAVGGLGDVTAPPPSTGSGNIAVIVGDGYVLKTSEGNNFRLYAVDALYDPNNGGVQNGVHLRWAPL